MVKGFAYLLLESNYQDVIHSILQVHAWATECLTINTSLVKSLKKIEKNSILITDYTLLAKYYNKLKVGKIICLVPRKIKIKHNLKNTIFYELPIIPKEFIALLTKN